MKCLLFIFFTISTIVNATSSVLAPRREECPQGAKVCGSTCIPDSYTCCRPSSIGCAPGTKCQLGSNDVMGCCPVGETCTGAAPLPSSIDETELTPTADPTTTIDDGPPTKATAPHSREDSTSDGTNKEKASDNDNLGASNRLDNTVSYLLVGAMVLLI